MFKMVTGQCILEQMMKTKHVIIKMTLLIISGLTLLALLLFVRYSLLVRIPTVTTMPIYTDEALSDEVRIADLLSRMSLKEKIGQMSLIERNSVLAPEDLASYGIGALLSGAGSKPDNNTRAGWQTMTSNFEITSRGSRLQIPILYGVDAIHGHGNVLGATIFPHNIGLGATNDPELVSAVARATAEEVTATGVTWSYSPNLDVPQDMRWGRVYEAFSDDPVLVSKLGAAYLKGMQSSSKKHHSDVRVALLGTPKHYLGAGGMVWNSSSNKNFKIDQGITPVDEQTLRAVYLPPYKEAVAAGALSIMVGLQSYGDTKMSAEHYLVSDVLKGELGFSGFVVSDWYSVYEIPGGDFLAATRAINAGVDMVMLPFEYKQFVRNVSFAVTLGLVSSHRVDDAVTRILRAKFATGLFDKSSQIKDEKVIGNDTHRTLARKAVAQSQVVLKNTDQILPLSPAISRVYVAGSAADNIGKQSGAWTVEWQGIDGNWLPGATSILAGFKQIAPAASFIFAADGVYATNSPKAALGIAVVGEKPYAEGWGDTAEPRLSTEDLTAIANLKKVATKVVVVLVTGRPLLIADEIAGWDALVVAWLPGSEGMGVGEVLFGIAKSTGTLPLQWPARIGDVPVSSVGDQVNSPALLFPRGAGLVI